MKPESSDKRTGTGALLLGLGLLATLGFLAIEITRGFPGLRQYELEFLHRLPDGEASFYILYLALLLPAGLLAALGISFLFGRKPFQSALDRLGSLPDGTFKLMVAVAGVLLVFLVSTFVLRNQPITDDERVYLFQADILSRGRLFLVPHGLHEFFDNVFIINNTKWYGKYPPGHPLALIPGVVAGIPRLVPALLAALNLLLFYAVAREFFSTRTARVAVLLLLFSPFFLFTGATLLAHTTTLAALLVLALAALRIHRGGGAGWGALAGIGAGYAFLTRPYTAIMVGAPIAIAGVIASRRDRAGFRAWGVAAGVAALFLAAFLAYNQALTGNPFRTGYSEIQGDQGKVIGFGQVLEGKYAHTPIAGVLNVGLTIVRLNFWSWGWPLGWLFVIAALMWSRRDRRLVPLWAILGATALGSVFYFSMGMSDAGPAKFYEILPVLTLLTVAGIQALDSRIAAGRRPGLSALAPGLVVAFGVLGLLFFTRIQAVDLRRVTGIIAEPYRLVSDLEDPRVLIFTGALQSPPFQSWVSSTPNNFPDPENPVLYVRDLGFRNRELMGRMPERIPYILQLDKDRKYTLTRLSGDEATKRSAEEKVREGIQFLRDKNSREALKSFLAATQIDPGYARAYLLMGWAFEQAGLTGPADPAYRRALELDPNNGDHYFFLGRFLGRQRKFEEGEELLLKALTYNPQSKEIKTALEQVQNKIPPP